MEHNVKDYIQNFKKVNKALGLKLKVNSIDYDNELVEFDIPNNTMEFYIQVEFKLIYRNEPIAKDLLVELKALGIELC